MLEIFNATVSHELRNPLGSIKAQHEKKAILLERMRKICEQNK